MHILPTQPGCLPVRPSGSLPSQTPPTYSFKLTGSCSLVTSQIPSIHTYLLLLPRYLGKY